MAFSFSMILVPVDFSVNTEVSVRKALEVVDLAKAEIHLFHVQTNTVQHGVTAEKKLRQWKTSIEETIPTIKVSYSIVQDQHVQASIVKFADVLKPDIIIIGKNAEHSWFPFLNTVTPNTLAIESGRAVLTVKPGALHNRIRTLVVAVSDDLPTCKMETITALCRKFRIKIHLVAFLNEENTTTEFSTTGLLKFYKWVRDTIHCPVDYAVLQGGNKARAMLNYAQKVNADILLVHPKTETRISWWNSHISDVLPAESKMQILAVQSALN
jgi:hypothetical protein